ncbi:MAG: S8 family serine peptidase [Spongiibacteraceae bacterium]
MSIHHPSLPYGCPHCATSGIMFKLRLGEAPDNTPALWDVNVRAQPPATVIDRGPIDRIVSACAGGVRAARLHSARANALRPGYRHRAYDDLEQTTGVARTYILRVPPGTPIAEMCDRLAQLPNIESVSPNYLSGTLLDVERAPADDDAEAWLPRGAVRMAEALAIEPGDPAVLIGLIDSGIATNHPEFRDRFRAGYDTVRLQPRDIGPGMELLGDFRQEDADPTDQFVGHGMACAGIIGAAGNAMPAGLAGDTRIIPMRALGAVRIPGKAMPIGLGAISDLDMALKRCIDLGARVINMSFGTDDRMLHPSSPRPHRDVVDYALARGCILVAASGNNGIETRYWPAAYPEVIAVGASNTADQAASFTTRGAHVDLCAPGERILTTALQGYQYATGTSFAAPFVAASAALLVAYAARHAHVLDTTGVRAILTRSARPFAVPATGCGAGILDAAAALHTLQAQILRAQVPSGERDAA